MAKKSEHTLGDAPIEDEHRETMTRVASILDRIFNPGLFNPGIAGQERTVGFVLMVFPFGDREGRCNYVSNGADRKDIVVLMKEMIARFEGQPEQSGRA